MKYNEYTIPVEDIVDEAPMGMIKTGLNKIASKIPGSIGAKATGALQTGGNANAMYKEFYTYLGQKGLKPTTSSISSFLQTKGVSPDIIKKYVVAPAGSTAQYPQGGAGQPAASGATPPAQPGAAPAAKAPRAPRPKKPAAAPAAAASQPQAAPAAPPQQAPAAAPTRTGFKTSVAQTPAQKKTADLLRAAKATRISEDTELLKLLSKVTKRL